MRLFALVFGGLLVVLAIGVAVWVGHEKALVGLAAYNLRNDMAILKKYQKMGAPGVLCPSQEDEVNHLEGYQLRFTSATEYVVETVCILPGTSKVFKSGSISGGVKRLFGSGVMLAVGEEVEAANGWVTLGYGKTEAAVGYFDDVPDIRWYTTGLEIGGENAAVGSCADWGFSCCAIESEVGAGASVNPPDCPTNCFQACRQLPHVLFFNSDPLVDPVSRTVTIDESPAEVEFGYEIASDIAVDKVMITYGDGKKAEPLLAREDSVKHTYQCGQARCVYQTVLSATDAEGHELMKSSLNRITVILEP